MTIAGSDSGGGAGIQADLRTFAMLGVHGCVAVTAVTVQNSVGVKGFHEIPLDVIAGQIEAVVDDIGIQAAKTGMLASSAIIDTIAETWRRQGLAGAVPLVVDPVCASMHGDPLLHPQRAGLPSESTVSARHTGHAEPRRGAASRRHRRRRRRVPAGGGPGAARARRRSGCWSRAGTCGPRRTAPTCCSTAPTSTSSTPTRIDTGHDHGAGDTLAAAIASALAHGVHRARRGRVRQALGDRMSARRIPVGSRPRPGVGAVQAAAR